MKKCPSCNAKRDNAEEVCGVCGHVFEGDDNRKHTMMGFPSLAAALEEAEAMEPEEPAKQTLFGFPAQKGEQQAAAEPEEDEEEFDATSIIPPSAFSFDGDDAEDPMRGTVAGMYAPSADDSYDEDDATAIVAGQAAFPPPLADDDDDDRTPVAGTLMGMTVEEMQAQERAGEDADEDNESTSRTSFGLPAVSRSDEPDEPEEDEQEEEEEYEDSPTQAWNPNSLDVGGKPDSDGRKKLLEKIRKSRPVKRETSKGIPSAPKTGTQRGMTPPDGPDLSALKKLKPKRELKATPVEFPEDIRETNEQPKVPRPSSAPASGILRGAKYSGSAPEAGTDPIGKTGYKLGPGEAPKEDSKRGVPIARISPPGGGADSEGLDEPISDPDFGLMETDIASAELISKAGFPGPLDGPTEDLSAAQQEMAATVPDRPVAPDIAFDETMAPGNSFPESALQPPQPAAAPSEPQPVPTPTAPAPQPALTPASSPEHVPPQFQTSTNQQKTMSQGVFDTFDGGSASSPQVGLPQQQQAQAQAPAGGSTDEDPLVRRIQTAFGALAGVLTLGVQLVVLLGSTPDSTGGKVLLALAMTLALAAIGAGAAPISTKARSGGLVVVGGILLLATIAGFAVGLPPTFLVTGLGAIVALMAAAFPSIAKFLL